MIATSKKMTKILIAFMVIGCIFATNVFATNGHQDHQGACARSTESISKGVGDLKYNGVLQEFANAVGIHGFNGSLTKQMEEKLVVGTVVHATTTSNSGCDGAGNTFDAGTRVLEKGEHVVIRIPPKYGKEVCKHPNPQQCKRIRVVVHTAMPVSCWNKNTGRLEVWIWVRKPKKHKPHHKHPHHKHPCKCKHKPRKPRPPQGTCNGNNVNNGNGSAGNCNVNVCVGNNVCNESTPPCNTCQEPPCTKCKPPLTCPPGNVPNEKGTECVKDGESGTNPGGGIPDGSNPKDEGEVGSNKCYDEATGNPVKEQPGGGCPPNSHG